MKRNIRPKVARKSQRAAVRCYAPHRPSLELAPSSTQLQEVKHRPGIHTLTYNRRLLLAALRVWELKHGIRTSW